jgi:glycerol-3-phosphate O-acyltransferase
LRVTTPGREWLPVCAGLTGSYLDSYAVVARAVREADAKTAKDKKALGAKAYALGERLLLLGELARPEALSRPVLDTAWDYLRDAGALESRDTLAEVERQLAAIR